MDLTFSSDDITRYKDREEILRKTVKQIEKDFIQFGFHIEFPEDLKYAYYSLFDQLKKFIQQIMTESTETFYSLLYRIDLSERAIHEEAKKNPETELEDIITHLILNRELQKVLTREYYSGRL